MLDHRVGGLVDLQFLTGGEAGQAARLSYRRAEEIRKAASGKSTLHQLRHSRRTHLAEAGEDVTMIKAKSRHRSLRARERYVNPGPTAIRELTNRHDPNRRTQKLKIGACRNQPIPFIVHLLDGGSDLLVTVEPPQNGKEARRSFLQRLRSDPLWLADSA